MRSESQRESNFRSEKIASEDKQRDRNAPIKKLVATLVCFRMRTKPSQAKWRGYVFHLPNSLLLIGEEVGSFMLTKLSYKAMLIKKMEQRQDRLMLQFGEHRVAI